MPRAVRGGRESCSAPAGLFESLLGCKARATHFARSKVLAASRRGDVWLLYRKAASKIARPNALQVKRFPVLD